MVTMKKLSENKTKKSLKPYLLSDFDKIGTKMFCKSYIFEKKNNIYIILRDLSNPFICFYTKLVFFVIFDFLELIFFFSIKYKIFILFWYKVYSNRMRNEKTMLFLLFFFYSLLSTEFADYTK